MMFCKEYNARTQDQPGMIIPVEITVYADKSFSFITKTPPASVLLLKAAGLEKGSGEPNKTKVGKITKDQLKKIAEYKMPDLNATDVDAAVAFFTSRGFADDSAQTVALTLLKQAKLENLKIFEILDGLKGATTTDISALVSEVLNNNRPSTSTLGYRQQISSVSKQRNVVP